VAAAHRWLLSSISVIRKVTVPVGLDTGADTIFFRSRKWRSDEERPVPHKDDRTNGIVARGFGHL
jgi:hypothetical protein